MGERNDMWEMEKLVLREVPYAHASAQESHIIKLKVGINKQAATTEVLAYYMKGWREQVIIRHDSHGSITSNAKNYCEYQTYV